MECFKTQKCERILAPRVYKYNKKKYGFVFLCFVVFCVVWVCLVFIAYDATSHTMHLINPWAAKHIEIQDRVVKDMLQNSNHNLQKNGIKKSIFFVLNFVFCFLFYFYVFFWCLFCVHCEYIVSTKREAKEYTN